MPNLLLTNYCNRKCSYCFARAKVDSSNHAPSDLSFENLVTVADFLKKSNCSNLYLLGGEPTLHKQFPLFLQYMLNRGFHVTVVSNGIIAQDTLKEILNVIKIEKDIASRLLFFININEDQSEEENFLQKQALKALGSLASLSFNIFSKKTSLDFLVDYVLYYKLFPCIRLGLALPTCEGENTYLKPDEYQAVMDHILSFAELCDTHNIQISFSCGFPLCLLDETKLGKLFLYKSQIQFICKPAIDINVDLDVWSCFPLSSLAHNNLKEFEDLKAIEAYFYDNFKKERSKGIFKKCEFCKYKEHGQCAGGCLALQMLESHLPKEVPAMIQ